MIEKNSDSNKKRILYLCNIPSPYMVDYLNELGKYCNLTAIFERSNSSERGNRWNNYIFKSFNGIVLKGINYSFDQAFSPKVILHLLKQKYDFIFITNPVTPTGILSIIFLSILKIEFIIESEGSFPKDGKGLKERLKKFIISKASLYFSTTKLADDYLIAYGAKPNKIIKYPYSSIFETDIISTPNKLESKIKIRKKLNIEGHVVVLAVGRFIKLKRFDELINVWIQQDSKYKLVIIGEGPEKELYESIINQNKLSNVSLIDFKPKDELKEYFDASDIFVLPTESDVWGLVINEAMSRGLPVITTDKCIAGLELIKDNGYIINNDLSDLKDKLTFLIENKQIRDSMSIKSLEIIQNYTIETMAKSHLDFFENYEGYRNECK